MVLSRKMIATGEMEDTKTATIYLQKAVD